MKIKYTHSHLNGLENLTVHRPELLQEVYDVIHDIDAETCLTKESREKTQIGRLLYSPKALNLEFRTRLYEKGWRESRFKYYATVDENIALETMTLPAEQQKEIILSHGEIPFYGFNQTDFVKDAVAIEVQFGKYAFVSYDIFVKHMAFFIANEIDVGIEILPTKAMTRMMSSGIGNYEGEIYNVYRQGRSTPAVPLVIIGIEP